MTADVTCSGRSWTSRWAASCVGRRRAQGALRPGQRAHPVVSGTAPAACPGGRGHQTRRRDRHADGPGADPGGDGPTGPAGRLARARAAFARSLRNLLAPDGLRRAPRPSWRRPSATSVARRWPRDPGGSGGSGPRWRPPRPGCSTGCPTQVIDHPAVVYDVAGVEELVVPADQVDPGRGGGPPAGAGGGGVRLDPGGGPGDRPGHRRRGRPGGRRGPRGVRLVQRPAPTWSADSTPSGIRADVAEVRRLTNAALMSKGRSIDERMLARSTELRLIRRWSGNGLVDALPFGSSLGKASVKAVGRIDRSDLARPGGGCSAPSGCHRGLTVGGPATGQSTLARNDRVRSCCGLGEDLASGRPARRRRRRP